MTGETDRAKDILRQLLEGFIQDPPETKYLEGYLDGLMMFAHLGLGMENDAVFFEACKIREYDWHEYSRQFQ